jgi:hypothetical protein
MIVHQKKFPPEDTIAIAVQWVKIKESLSKTSVPEVVIVETDQEMTATEADIEIAMVVEAIEVVTEKEIIAKAQTDQIEVATETEMPTVLQIVEVIEIEMPTVEVQIVEALEIEMQVKAQTEVVTEKEITAKVQTDQTEVVLEKKIEILVETDPEMEIVKDQKENINHSIARMQFTMLQPIVRSL